MENIKLNCKNLGCPWPIIELSNAIKKMNTGDTIEMEATYPLFEGDLKIWITQTKHELISFRDGDPMVAVIRKR